MHHRGNICRWKCFNAVGQFHKIVNSVKAISPAVYCIMSILLD
nr:MAG TPA: hypothetical protein [Caudoviricetes sp.]